MAKWYWLNTSYACAGIAIDDNGIIVDGAPIFRRMRGKPLLVVLANLKNREQLLEVYPMYNNNGTKSKRIHVH